MAKSSLSSTVADGGSTEADVSSDVTAQDDTTRMQDSNTFELVTSETMTSDIVKSQTVTSSTIKSDTVTFDVGGTLFKTARDTVRNCHFLAKIVAEEQGDAPYFIDRDPDLFRVVLQYLRTGRLLPPAGVRTSVLQNEFGFYGLDDLVKQSLEDIRSEDSTTLTYVKIMDWQGTGHLFRCSSAPVMNFKADPEAGLDNGAMEHLLDTVLQVEKAQPEPYHPRA